MFSRQKTSGNAFIYILIAVALLGGLTYVLAKNSDNNPGSELTDAAAKAAATSIMAYAAQSQSAIEQMMANGTQVDDINFTLPSNANFNTAPTTNKLFHPDGGGLQYKALPKGSAASGISNPAPGYYIGRFNNVQWTPTTANDVIFVAFGLITPVCSELNRKITGSPVIPSVTGTVKFNFIDSSLYTGGSNTPTVTSAFCPACDGKPSLSISNCTYYSILVGR